ncbi:hypothetical protein GJ496_009784 [Pomphorhynchus laevis]|nr:hypothetical protein GJ496_009784 [Pomphorhynchus laevis]
MEIARKITAEFQGNPTRWKKYIAESEELKFTYEEALDKFKTLQFPCDILTINLAAQAYERIFRLITRRSETDMIFQPRYARRNAASTKKDHSDLLRRRNRALYFNNTSKLAKEILNNEIQIKCPLEPNEVETHYKDLLSNKDDVVEGETNKNIGNSCSTQRNHNKNNYTFPELEISEIKEALKNMSKSTAAGQDRVGAKLQKSIDKLIQVLSPMGLKFSSNKCKTISQEFIQGLQYLGLNPFTKLKAEDVNAGISSAMLVLRSSQLSPSQIAHLANDYYLPKILYNCNASSLTMRIPRYTNNGFLHLPTSMSGLGIRSIAYEVAPARLRVQQRYQSLHDYSDQTEKRGYNRTMITQTTIRRSNCRRAEQLFSLFSHFINLNVQIFFRPADYNVLWRLISASSRLDFVENMRKELDIFDSTNIDDLLNISWGVASCISLGCGLALHSNSVNEKSVAIGADIAGITEPTEPYIGKAIDNDTGKPTEVYNHFSTLLNVACSPNMTKQELEPSSQSIDYVANQEDIVFNIVNITLLAAVKTMQKNTAPGNMSLRLSYISRIWRTNKSILLPKSRKFTARQPSDILDPSPLSGIDYQGRPENDINNNVGAPIYYEGNDSPMYDKAIQLLSSSLSSVFNTSSTERLNNPVISTERLSSSIDILTTRSNAHEIIYNGSSTHTVTCPVCLLDHRGRSRHRLFKEHFFRKHAGSSFFYSCGVCARCIAPDTSESESYPALTPTSHALSQVHHSLTSLDFEKPRKISALLSDKRELHGASALSISSSDNHHELMNRLLTANEAVEHADITSSGSDAPSSVKIVSKDMDYDNFPHMSDEMLSMELSRLGLHPRYAHFNSFMNVTVANFSHKPSSVDIDNLLYDIHSYFRPKIVNFQADVFTRAKYLNATPSLIQKIIWGMWVWRVPHITQQQNTINKFNDAISTLTNKVEEMESIFSNLRTLLPKLSAYHITYVFYPAEIAENMIVPCVPSKAHSTKCKHRDDDVVGGSTQACVLRFNQTESVIYDLCNDLEPNIGLNVQNETTLCLPDHLLCTQQPMICSPSLNTEQQCVSSDNTSQPDKTSSSRSTPVGDSVQCGSMTQQLASTITIRASKQPAPKQVQVASNQLCRLLSKKDIESPDLDECEDLSNNISDVLNAGCTSLSLTTSCFNQQHVSSTQPYQIYDINSNRLGQYNIAAIAEHLNKISKSKSLLETLGLHAVQIQPSGNDLLRSVSYSIYKNPTCTKEVRRNIIAEKKSDKAKWSQFLSINDETTIVYYRLLSDLEQGRSIYGTTNNIHIRNGVKQRDPLPTFIFAVCLSEATQERRQNVHGFLHKSVTIYHLTYTDDMVIVANTSSKRYNYWCRFRTREHKASNRTRDFDQQRHCIDQCRREAYQGAIVDIAVAYETCKTKLELVTTSKEEKYMPIVPAVAREHNINQNDVEIVGMVVGSRGSFNKGLLNRLNKFGLRRRAEKNMAVTAAEQSLQLSESVFGELSRSFLEFVDLSVNSELRSAKRVVNPNYDDAKPCIDNFHNRLRDEWGKCLTQANAWQR